MRRSRRTCTPGCVPTSQYREERGDPARGCGIPGTTSTRIGLSTKTDVLLADEAPIAELDELRTLIQEGQERGFLTIEQITTTLEEVEITKEQLTELHSHLDEQGIAIVGADGKPVTSESGRAEAAAAERQSPSSSAETRKKPEIDLTVEPSLDSLRLYLRSIGRV